MEFKFLNNLNLSDLENLKKCLSGSCEDSERMLSEIERNILHKKNLQLGLIDFSCDRIPNYRKENEERCLEILSEIMLKDVPFLTNSFSTNVVNRSTYFAEKYGFCDYDKTSLLVLDELFKDKYCIYYHEGICNTYNYIKNYIYFLLLNNSKLTKNDLFENFDEKYQLVSRKIADIVMFLLEIKNKTDRAQLSVGNKGLSVTVRRGNKDLPLTMHQQVIADAVAFGTSLEKLQSGNYEDCKRLLFIPKKRAEYSLYK